VTDCQLGTVAAARRLLGVGRQRVAESNTTETAVVDKPKRRTSTTITTVTRAEAAGQSGAPPAPIAGGVSSHLPETDLIVTIPDHPLSMKLSRRLRCRRQSCSHDPDYLAPVWPSGRFAMTMRPGTVGICSKIETGTFNTADSTSLGMAVRD